jgi:hypothetical protein
VTDAANIILNFYRAAATNSVSDNGKSKKKLIKGTDFASPKVQAMHRKKSGAGHSGQGYFPS